MNLSRLLIESINDDSVSQLKVQYSQDLVGKLSKLPENDYLKFLYEHIDEADVSSIICVQIPSYKDIDVINTVNSLLVNAVNPDRIRIKIFFQDDDVDLLKQLQAISNVEVKQIPSCESQGLCYARYQCNLMMDDDTNFAMHIDSHMRCAKFWDVALILSWQLCNDDKAIVSQRPFDFSEFYDERLDSDIFIEKVHHYFMKLVYHEYSKDYCNFLLPKPLTVYPDSSITSRQSACISGGLVFGKSEIDVLVPSDSNMYFVADENSMAIRYWTHGFNIYSPDYYFVYHLYNRPATIEQHLGVSVDVGYNSVSVERYTLEQNRLRTLFGLSCEVDIDLGDFSLGSKRTLEQYERFCGVDFRNRIIKDYSIKGDCNISRIEDTNIFKSDIQSVHIVNVRCGIDSNVHRDFVKFVGKSVDNTFVEHIIDFDKTRDDDVSYSQRIATDFAKGFSYGDVILIQHPFWYCFNFEVEVIKQLHLSGAVVCVWMTDIANLLWYGNDYIDKIVQELSFINFVDWLIVPDETYYWLIREYGLKFDISHVLFHQIYDYDVSFTPQYVPFAKRVVYAGNVNRLSESDCWYNVLNHSLDIYGCGTQPDWLISENIHYHQYYSMHHNLSEIESFYKPLSQCGGFGLIWAYPDMLQMYVKYYAPYKLSHYLIAGLPVIVYSGAWYADFVRKYNIGFTVDDIRDINTILETVSESEYRIMSNNALQIAEHIKAGMFTRDVIRQLMINVRNNG